MLDSPVNQLTTPPSLGICDVISAKDLAELAAATVASGSIPIVASENPFRPIPNIIISPANLERLFSPVNQLTTPPSVGITEVISAKVLAALDAAITLSGTIPVTASEKPLRPWPSKGSCPANLEMLDSPENQATIPPSLGITAVISAKDLAAFAPEVTFSITIPVTASEKPLRPIPRVTISVANFEMLDSPANHDFIPPSLGITEVISAKDLAAFAAEMIFSGIIPATESEKPLRP